MKTIGMFMVMLMTLSVVAGAGFALAAEGGQGGDDGPNYVTVQVSPNGVNPVQLSGSVASPSEAIGIFPEDGVLSAEAFDVVIDEVDNSVGENGKKVGFAEATYGKGIYTGTNSDSAGFVKILWANASVLWPRTSH